MNVLLLGGPFTFRTLKVPDDHVGSIYIPLPIDVSAVVYEELNDYSLVPEMQVAEYVPGSDLVSHDTRRVLPVYHGRIYDFLDQR